MILNASDTRSLVAPPPTSRKLAGTTAVQVHDVHGAHGETGAVDHAADVAVERDVVDFPLRGMHLARVLLRGIVHFLQSLLAVHRVCCRRRAWRRGSAGCRRW